MDATRHGAQRLLLLLLGVGWPLAPVPEAAQSAGGEGARERDPLLCPPAAAVGSCPAAGGQQLLSQCQVFAPTAGLRGGPPPLCTLPTGSCSDLGISAIAFSSFYYPPPPHPPASIL